jgi:hypothetical protein
VPVSVTSISMNAGKTTLQVGETTTITLTAFYSNATSASIPLTCTPYTGSVSITASCTATAVTAGTTTYIGTYSGHTDSITFTVTAPVSVTSISLNAGKTTLEVGETTTVTLTAFYSDGTSASVPLTCTPYSGSSFSMTASCTVTGLAAGTNSYTRSYAGYTDSITFTVTVPYSPPVVSYPTTELRIYAANASQTYLGCINCSQYASDSVANTYGSYGSRYSSTSILNRYSQFGGRYSTYSPCNPYTQSAPRIYDGAWNYYGRLTVNPYGGQTSISVVLAWLAGVCAATT